MDPITEAIERCGKQATDHGKAASRTILTLAILIFFVFLFVVVAAFGIYQYLRLVSPKVFEELHAPELINEFNIILIAIGAIISVLVGVFISIYRGHLREATRNERMSIAFHRMAVAGNSNATGFKTEVRNALTKDAFSIDDKSGCKTDKLESPIPGHPGIEILTAFINAIKEMNALTRKASSKVKNSVSNVSKGVKKGNTHHTP